MQETSEKDMSPFGMKRERQRVSECIERLIQLSTADGSVEPNTESPPQLWDTFMSHVCQNHGHLLHHHKDGKYVTFAVVATMDKWFSSAATAGSASPPHVS